MTNLAGKETRYRKRLNQLKAFAIKKKILKNLCNSNLAKNFS